MNTALPPCFVAVGERTAAHAGVYHDVAVTRVAVFARTPVTHVVGAVREAELIDGALLIPFASAARSAGIVIQLAAARYGIQIVRGQFLIEYGLFLGVIFIVCHGDYLLCFRQDYFHAAKPRSGLVWTTPPNRGRLLEILFDKNARTNEKYESLALYPIITSLLLISIE